VPSTSARVLAGRVLLVLAAAVAVGFAFTTRGGPAPIGLAAVRFACPMHPEVTQDGPGECPVCHMDLEPARRPGAPAADAPAHGEHPPASGEAAADPASVAMPGEGDVRKAYDVVHRRVFSQEVRAPASHEGGGVVRAVLYLDEVAALTPGERGVFVRSDAPGGEVPVRLDPEPATPWDRSTAQVRFQVEGDAAALPVGAAGWVRLAARPREVIAVPVAAVVPSPEGPYVLVASADHRTLTRRPVTIGRIFYGLAVVVSGLRAREHIAVRSTFFLDAERRLRAAAPGAAP